VIKDILIELGIDFEESQEHITFNILSIDVFYDYKTKKLYINKKYFSKIPHINSDGSICLYGNVDLILKELDDNEVIKKTLDTYLPWLISMSPELKVAEFLGEINFFTKNHLNYNYIKNNKPIGDFKSIYISTPDELWETIENLSTGMKCILIPDGFSNIMIYIQKENDNTLIHYDYPYINSAKRVSGSNFNFMDEQIGFIGMGSVNSYCLKSYLSIGYTNIVLVDDDVVEIGNMFRFAFPYLGKTKISAAESFIQGLGVADIIIKKIETKITKESPNFFNSASIIFISVDNYVSWINIYEYIIKNQLQNKEVVFLGIDVYGNYGKFIKIKSIDAKEFKRLFYNFLLFITPGDQRHEMVANGCGNSLAIYSESDIIKLINEVKKNEKKNLVIKVDF